jgi:hypothetical protein
MATRFLRGYDPRPTLLVLYDHTRVEEKLEGVRPLL